METILIDSGATLLFEMIGNPFIPTNTPLQKTFQLPSGQQAIAMTQEKLHHPLRETARSVNMVPVLKCNSLIRISKLVDVNFITVLVPEEVKIYDGNIMTLTVINESVLKG